MKTYPLFKVHVKIDNALIEIEKVLKSGFINEGEQVTQLHNLLRPWLGDQSILVNSCTSAITLALHLIKLNDESEKPWAQNNPRICSTPMTCVATNTPIVTQNYGYLVWCDVDANTGMITLDTLKKAYKKFNMKVLVIVAWAGIVPHDLPEIYGFCKKKGIKLVLDAAHAFGAQYDGQAIHQLADYTCYSFQAIKHFTTGDGGALVCNNTKDYERAKALKWFGLDRDKSKDEKGNWKGQQWDVDIEEAGFKFNMNNVAAAIGISQVPHIGINLAQHRLNAAIYQKLLANEVHLNLIDRSHGSSDWVYAVTLKKDSPIKRDELLKRLNAEGIMAGLVHVPNDKYTTFKQYKQDLPGVRSFSKRQFALPCGWWLDTEDIEHIVLRVKWHLDNP